MALIVKIQASICININFSGLNFKNKYKNLFFFKKWEKVMKIQKIQKAKIFFGKLIKNERLPTMLNELVSAL